MQAIFDWFYLCWLHLQLLAVERNLTTIYTQRQALESSLNDWLRCKARLDMEIFQAEHPSITL